MHRFYADSESPESGRVYLSPEDAHHALHVLRLKNGDAVELILNGERYHAGLSLEEFTEEWQAAEAEYLAQK